MKNIFISILSMLIFILINSCSSSNEQSSTSRYNLKDTHWILKALNDKKIFIPESGKEIYIELSSKENKANGNAGCNTFFTNYTLTGKRLKFGPIAATRMFCEGLMETESSFLKALENTVRYKITGNYLQLYDSTKLLAKFEAIGTEIN